MRKIITRAQAIKYVIWAMLVVAIITIFPLRLWDEKIISKGNEHPAGVVSIGGENTALQTFLPEYDHIASIGVMVEGDYFDDTLCLRVFDSGYVLLREQTVTVSESGYADVYLNLDVNVGDTYYYTVEGVSTDFLVQIENTGNSGTANNGAMQYAGENKDAYNIITRYTYEQPLRKMMSLVWIVVLMFVGGLLSLGIDACAKRIVALNELCTIQWAVKRIFNPIVIVLAIAALVCVGPLHMFSIYIADIVVMSLGIVFLVTLLLYTINRDHSQDEWDPIPYLKKNWQNLAQSICIALALWACVNYMNALYEIFHDIAWRKMVFFLGLGIIVTMTKQEVLNVYNLVLLIIGTIASRLYYTQNLPDMVDEYHVEAMLATCRCIPLILILIAYIIRCIVLAVKDKKNVFRIISWPYALLCIVMAAAMIIRRNTRYWPIMMAVVAGVLAFRFLFWEERKNFLGNVSNGILIHFFACVAYALWHRPYEAFEHVRYPFVFHTVTITAEYMSLVMAAAAVKLFVKYNRTKQLKKCIGETFVFGTAASYTLFTMSRTGMIAVVGMGLVMWVAYSFGPGILNRLKHLGIVAGVVIVSVIVCMPIMFSLQKAVPAMVGEPKTYIVDAYPEALCVSKDWDCDEYITTARFAKAFCSKMLGINEDKIRLDLYTIDGRRDDVYIKPTDLAERDGFYEEGAVLLSGETRFVNKPVLPVKMYTYDEDGTFIPPFVWNLEGPEPAHWNDEEYWVYRPKENEWHYAFWREQEEENADVSNGRMDIYRAYFEQINDEGHEDMGAILQNGEEAAHAHDIYLQVAFDHGKIVGIIFIIWVFMTCVQALIVFLRRRKTDSSVGIVLAVSVTYAVAGLTEWVSHPCNPVGMIMLICLIPMVMYRYE